MWLGYWFSANRALNSTTFRTYSSWSIKNRNITHSIRIVENYQRGLKQKVFEELSTLYDVLSPSWTRFVCNTIKPLSVTFGRHSTQFMNTDSNENATNYPPCDHLKRKQFKSVQWRVKHKLYLSWDFEARGPKKEFT